MIVLGLTGSIGMGKSTLAGFLRDMRIPVHDADACVHAVMQPDGAAFLALQTLFPESIKNGQVCRKTLGGIVFADLQKRQALEAVLHPLVQASEQKFVLDCVRKNLSVCVLDIPLLYETGAQTRVDKVLLATAPYSVQKRRVMTRVSMTAEKFTAICAAQMPDRQKRALADYCINTARGKGFARMALRRIVAEVI